jgi:hypothetical protein
VVAVLGDAQGDGAVVDDGEAPGTTLGLVTPQAGLSDTYGKEILNTLKSSKQMKCSVA